MKKIESKNGFAFLEIMIVTAIILYAAYKLFNLYFNKPLMSGQAERALLEQGALDQDLATTSYKGIVASVREKLQKSEKQHSDALSQIK
jgi:Tfp pilus assembly protein PilE